MLAVVLFAAAAAERKLKPCRLWLPVFRCLQKPLPTCSRLLPGWAESCRHQQLPLCRLSLKQSASLKGISLVRPRALTCPPLLRLHDRSLPLTLSRPWCVPALRTSLLLLLPCLFGLPPRGGTCRIRTVSNLRDPLDGPCVIASATPPGKPVTCVDFVSASPASTVLVLVPRALGPSARKATLHNLSGPSNPGPQPRKLAAAPELDDKAATGEDSQKCEWATFRLTLAREFCDAERYEAGGARPQALPALLLPPEVVSLIIRTFAVTTYDSELTCLFGFVRRMLMLCTPVQGPYLQVLSWPRREVRRTLLLG